MNCPQQKAVVVHWVGIFKWQDLSKSVLFGRHFKWNWEGAFLKISSVRYLSLSLSYPLLRSLSLCYCRCQGASQCSEFQQAVCLMSKAIYVLSELFWVEHPLPDTRCFQDDASSCGGGQCIFSILGKREMASCYRQSLTACKTVKF